MSRFYLSGVNSRGNTVTAAGRSSGQDVHLRGWNAGVQVFAAPKELDPERDQFNVYLTGGSHGSFYPSLLGKLMETHDGRIIFKLTDHYAEQFGVEYQTATVRPAKAAS